MTTTQSQLLEEIRQRVETNKACAWTDPLINVIAQKKNADIKALLQINEKLRKALEFYANEKNWQEYPVSGYYSLMKDHCSEGFDKARKALSFIPAKAGRGDGTNQ